jgi:hypothetical protein
MRDIYRELSGQGAQDYITKTNRALLEKNIIRRPLSPTDLWAITDIHVGDGEGISIERMKHWMPDYGLVSQRAYGFYGELWSALPASLRKAEEALIARRSANGQYAGALWQRKASSGWRIPLQSRTPAI